MAASDCKQLPELGPDNKASQSLQFDFPKREFGKTKIVRRAFQAQWFWEVALATLRLFPGSSLLPHLYFCLQDGETETVIR